jgi:hypothetical protein
MRLLAAYVRTNRCMCIQLYVLHNAPSNSCASLNDYRCNNEHDMSFHHQT